MATTALVGAARSNVHARVLIPEEASQFPGVFLSNFMADHVAEQSHLLVIAILRFTLDGAIHHKVHHFEEEVVFFQVVRPEEVALARKIDQKGRGEGKVTVVCSLVDEEVKVAVGVVFVFGKLDCDDAAVFIVVVIQQVIVLCVLQLREQPVEFSMLYFVKVVPVKWVDEAA